MDVAGLDLWVALACLGVVTIGSTLQGVIGLGMGLLAAPLLALADQPERDCSEATDIASRHLADVEERLRQLQVPVAVNAPDELVGGAGCLVELVRFYGALDLADSTPAETAE